MVKEANLVAKGKFYWYRIAGKQVKVAAIIKQESLLTSKPSGLMMDKRGLAYQEPSPKMAIKKAAGCFLRTIAHSKSMPDGLDMGVC